jgi:hypothetical protein
MAHPVLVAGIVAVLSIGAISVSFEASARPGGPGGPGGSGLGAGRSAGGHFGAHRSHARPFFHGRHLLRHGGHHVPRHGIRHGHHHKAFDKKHGIGLGLPFTGGGVWDVGSYGFGVRSYAPPADPGPLVSGGGAAAPYRHVCRSEVQVVPATRGGETSVTVTSCYVVPY